MALPTWTPAPSIRQFLTRSMARTPPILPTEATPLHAAVAVQNQTGGDGWKNLPRRYVPKVPSVTGRKEKQKPFCIQQGQTKCGRTITLPPEIA